MASVFWMEQNCDVMDWLEMKKARGETPGRRRHVDRTDYRDFLRWTPQQEETKMWTDSEDDQSAHLRTLI